MHKFYDLNLYTPYVSFESIIVKKVNQKKTFKLLKSTSDNANLEIKPYGQITLKMKKKLCFNKKVISLLF